MQRKDGKIDNESLSNIYMIHGIKGETMLKKQTACLKCLQKPFYFFPRLFRSPVGLLVLIIKIEDDSCSLVTEFSLNVKNSKKTARNVLF